MHITSGTSLLLMLFCFAKPYHCLADTCSVRNAFLQTCPKFEINDSAKNTIRTVLFEQQSVERESRMVNIREKVGTERLVNNRRIVDSDSRISNFPSKSANNDRTENNFRRSTFTERIASRQRDFNNNLKDLRVRDSNVRDFNNRRDLTRESRIFNIERRLTTRNQNLPEETRQGRRIALSSNNRRASQPISRESFVDREARVVERMEIRLKDRDSTTNRDATRVIRKIDRLTDVTRNSQELSRQTRSAEGNRHRRTIGHSISSTRSEQTRNLTPLKDENRVDRMLLASNNRSPLRSATRTSSRGLRESLTERRTMNRNTQIQDRRTISRGLRLSDLQRQESRNFQRIVSDRTARVENREIRDRRPVSNFQIIENERRNSRTLNSADNRRVVDRTTQRLADHQRTIDESPKNIEQRQRQLNEQSRAGGVKLTDRDSRVRERSRNLPASEERLTNDERRQVEDRTSRHSRNAAVLERDSRVRERSINARTSEERLNNQERRQVEDRTSRQSLSDTALERDSRVRERSINARTSEERLNNQEGRQVEDRTSRFSRSDAALERDSRVRERSINARTSEERLNNQERRQVEDRTSRQSLSDTALERDSRVRERSINARTSEERLNTQEGRQVEDRTSRFSRSDAALERDSRVRERSINARTSEERLNNQERRQVEDRTSRLSRSDAVLERDSRVRERSINVRTAEERLNNQERRQLEERTSRRSRSINARITEEKLNIEQRRRIVEPTSRHSRGEAVLERDSRIRVRLSGKSNDLRENSNNRREIYADRSRRISKDPTSERRITEPTSQLRSLRHLRISNGNRVENRRTIERNLQNVKRLSSDDRVNNNRFSVFNDRLSTKDENNNERIQVNDRQNSNDVHEMMAKKTAHTTWSNVLTTTLSVLLFAHMIGTSLDLKKYQYFTNCFNAVKEKVF